MEEARTRPAMGEMIFDRKVLAKTGELKWRDNEVGRSCIPDGLFPVTLHEDGKRLRVHDVPGRTGIRIEFFNYPEGFPNADGSRRKPESKGCIGVGNRLTANGEGVAESRKTMAAVRAAAVECLAQGDLYIRVRWASE